MIYCKLGIVIDEDDADFDSVIAKIKGLDGVDEVEIEKDTYHEYNVDSDPFWEGEGWNVPEFTKTDLQAEKESVRE